MCGCKGMQVVNGVSVTSVCSVCSVEFACNSF